MWVVPKKTTVMLHDKRFHTNHPINISHVESYFSAYKYVPQIYFNHASGQQSSWAFDDEDDRQKCIEAMESLLNLHVLYHEGDA